MRTLFELIDSDRDGVITKRELMHAATMSEDCMAIMQRTIAQHLLQPSTLPKVSKRWTLSTLGR